MIRWLAATSLAAFLIAAPLRALEEAPQEFPILSLTGEITTTNDGDAARFDGRMLRDLDWREVETFTPFTNGPQVFAGPTLASVLAAVGAEGGTLRARAVNDYSVDIAASDATEYDVLIAVEHNGKTMRVREKGPFWIVYPQTEARALENNFANEMIWQLTEIEVLP